LPKDIQAIVSQHINAAAVAERADVAALTTTLQEQLTAKGMKFNSVAAVPFRDKLKNAGFYQEWQKKFGPEAWSTLEGAVGSLSG
jgi:TRAP-type transport system periplasmic protein